MSTSGGPGNTLAISRYFEQLSVTSSSGTGTITETPVPAGTIRLIERRVLSQSGSFSIEADIYQNVQTSANLINVHSFGPFSTSFVETINITYLPGEQLIYTFSNMTSGSTVLLTLYGIHIPIALYQNGVVVSS